ncbi:MAG TPA: hypothetical protein VMS88_02285 [Terriglobales bacterium]|nr:hypothetical protein [Terriglobales bacterium]
MKRMLAVLFLGLLLPLAAQAATIGTSNVTLQALATAQVSVTDPTINLTPTSTDYDNGYVEATGTSGLRVRVQTNCTTGMQLLVACKDAAPQIALADLLVRTQTAPQGGGTSISTYTPITAANQTLWTSTTPVRPWLTVTTDVRVQNLINYNDAVTAGTTSYTNTLTYTVVTQ